MSTQPRLLRQIAGHSRRPCASLKCQPQLSLSPPAIPRRFASDSSSFPLGGSTPKDPSNAQKPPSALSNGPKPPSSTGAAPPPKRNSVLNSVLGGNRSSRLWPAGASLPGAGARDANPSGAKAPGQSLSNILEKGGPAAARPRAQAASALLGIYAEEEDKAKGDIPHGSDRTGGKEEEEKSGPYILHILANRNNTHATFTNPKGLILATATAGNLGLRKAARGTSDAGYQTVAHLAEKVLALPMHAKSNSDKNKKYHGVDLKRATEEGIHMKFSGFGPGRDQAFRAIVAAGWKINMITDVTPFAHGGCRPRKKRRL